MLAIGEELIYGNSGVCRVAGIQDMTVGTETHSYYVLKPAYQASSTIYVRVDSDNLQSKIRRILSEDEILNLIRQMPFEDTIWESDDNKRRDLYKEILAGSDRIALVRMIKTLFLRSENLKSLGKGKKLHASDERFLKDAEKILYEEFAYVLDIKREDVLTFICRQIEAISEPEDE
ncbi:MAG: CarD family transcriptional regulator [Lachnospiraceae bacterium]|jgi:CarD family transcriptional regulator|nr:CarD family transcriptional regulator [Lachnospiraceae bacterium]